MSSLFGDRRYNDFVFAVCVGLCPGLCVLMFAISSFAQRLFRRQRRLLVEIQASKDAGPYFVISVTTLGTDHDSAFIRGTQTMSMPAHPSHLAGWVSNNKSEVTDILGYH